MSADTRHTRIQSILFKDMSPPITGYRPRSWPRSMRLSFNVCALLLAGFAQGQDLDSLQSVWKNAQLSDSIRSGACFEHSLDHTRNGNLDSALVLAKRSLAFAEADGSPRLQGGSWKLISNVLADQGAYDASREATTKAMEFWSSLNDMKRMGDMEIGYGYTYILQGAYNLGLAHNLKALDHYTAKPDSDGIAHAENNIGALYAMLNEYDKSIEHSNRALAIMSARKDPRIANVIAGLGKNYQMTGDFDEAKRTFFQAMDLFAEDKNTEGVARIWNALSNLYLEQGSPDSAVFAARRTIELTKQPFQIIQASLNESRALQKQGRWREALAPAQRAEDLAVETNSLDTRASANKELSMVHEALGDKGRALEAFRLYVLLNDSVRNDEQVKEQTRMEVTHAFDQQILADSLSNAAEKEQTRLENLATLTKEKNRRNLFLLSGVGLLVFAGALGHRLRETRRSRAAIQKEKDISEGLLLNILPAEVAMELKAKGQADAVQIDLVTVLFTDFKGFTALSETLSPRELVHDLNECFSGFDRITGKYGIEKIKTIGDAYMAAGGLPTPNSTHATDVIQAALEMRDFVAEGKARKIAAGLPFFEVRIGIHTGPVVAGIVGVKKFQYDIWGDTVNTASRMESSGEVGMVNISGTTYALVSGVNGPSTAPGIPAFTFTPRGRVQAKGKGEMEMFFVDRSSTE